MQKWFRAKYFPCLPMGEDGRKITGCQKHIDLSRKAACEGAVLLKNNDNLLPINEGKKVAVFGKAQYDYVKGGGGSGAVNVSYVRNIYDGLKIKEDEGKIKLFDSLIEYYANEMKRQYEYLAEQYKDEVAKQYLEELLRVKPMSLKFLWIF